MWHTLCATLALALAVTAMPQQASPTTAAAAPNSTPASTGAAPFSSASAKALAPYLPSYTYNLTMESNATRTAICAQTVQDCTVSRCSNTTGTVTTNFCNPATMGWNCQCSMGVSRLQPQIVPVNSFDCPLRASACLDACQNTNSSVPVKSVTMCQNACNYIIGSTCSTGDQAIPQYQVNAFGDTPKYGPDTSAGGVAAGITTASSALARVGVSASTLAIILGAASSVALGLAVL